MRPQRGQSREFLQAGIELVGAPAPQGTAEALTLLCDVLDAVGLADYRIGLGDVALYQALLDGYGVDGAARERVLHELVTRDFVGLEREVAALGLGSEAATCSRACRSCAAGRRCWRISTARRPRRRRACAACTRCWSRASPSG